MSDEGRGTTEGDPLNPAELHRLALEYRREAERLLKDGVQHVLAGKDYFTVREAAAYAGISYSHWRDRVQREFPPGIFKGKLIYRRVDVQRYVEQNTSWPSLREETSEQRQPRLLGAALPVHVQCPLPAPGGRNVKVRR